MLLFNLLNGKIMFENTVIYFVANVWLFTVAEIDGVTSSFFSCLVVSEALSRSFVGQQVVLVVARLELVLIRTLMPLADVAVVGSRMVFR